MSNDEPSAPPFSPSRVFDLAPPENDRPLTRRERSVVVARIHALMEYWGITVDDVLADTPASEPPTPQPPPPIKYRHPVTGQTWDGRGSHPEWLRHALLQEGLRVDELKPG